MIPFLDLFNSLFSTAVLLLLLARMKSFTSIFCVLLAFDIFLVFPLFVEFLLGVSPLNYYGYKLALNDIFTSFMYGIFIFCSQIFFYREVSYQACKQELKQFVVNNKRTVYIKYLCILGVFSLLFVILLSPNPFVYFTSLDAFSMSIENRTPAEIAYHKRIVKKMIWLCFICVFCLKYIDSKKSLGLLIIRIIGIVLVAFTNGKRTRPMMMVGGCLLIDFFKDANNFRGNLRKAFFIIALIIGYFMFYANMTGKIKYSKSLYALFSDYFFRDNTARVAIYSVLHPDKLKILEYPLQTVLYNIFFFVPRSVWTWKGYPYSVYFFSGVQNFSSLVIADWRFQTSIVGEFISNFNLLGMPIFLLFVKKTTRFFNTQHFIYKLVGTALLCLLMVFEFSDMFKIIAVALCLFPLLKRIKWSYFFSIRGIV